METQIAAAGTVMRLEANGSYVSLGRRSPDGGTLCSYVFNTAAGARIAAGYDASTSADMDNYIRSWRVAQGGSWAHPWKL